jgi:hypothetical protein
VSTCSTPMDLPSPSFLTDYRTVNSRSRIIPAFIVSSKGSRVRVPSRLEEPDTQPTTGRATHQLLAGSSARSNRDQVHLARQAKPLLHPRRTGLWL